MQLNRDTGLGRVLLLPTGADGLTADQWGAGPPAARTGACATFTLLFPR